MRARHLAVAGDQARVAAGGGLCIHPSLGAEAAHAAMGRPTPCTHTN
jgi:hypothetical protein